jgi:hypothetical protein
LAEFVALFIMMRMHFIANSTAIQRPPGQIPAQLAAMAERIALPSAQTLAGPDDEQ